MLGSSGMAVVWMMYIIVGFLGQVVNGRNIKLGFLTFDHPDQYVEPMAAAITMALKDYRTRGGLKAVNIR